MQQQYEDKPPVITKHEYGPDSLTIMWDNGGGPDAARGWLLFVGHQVTRKSLVGYKWDIVRGKHLEDPFYAIPISTLKPGRDIYIQVAAITDTLIPLKPDEKTKPSGSLRYEVVYSDEVRIASPPMGRGKASDSIKHARC